MKREVAAFCVVNHAVSTGLQTAYAEMTLHLLGIRNMVEVIAV